MRDDVGRRERARERYRTLLRLLPRDLRSRFGRDMEDVFVHRLEAAGSRAPHRLWVWTRAIADVSVQAFSARIGARTPGEAPARRIEALAHDCRQAARSLRAAPGITIPAVVTLGLGIGLATATFSVVNAVFLEPLPYAEADRLVVVWPEVNANRAMTTLAEDRMSSLERVSGSSMWTLTLTGLGDPREIDAMRVSAQHFEVLGVRPMLGRAFQPGDDLPGGAGVAILSHDLWVRAFGADTSVVGRVVELGGADHERREVIGVMPPGVQGLTQQVDLWIPLGGSPREPLEQDDSWYVNVRIGRLADGATLEQATSEVRDYATYVQQRVPDVFSEEEARAATVQPLRSYRAGDVGTALWVALGAVTLVLLMACGNVANLLLARSEGRVHDLGVRAALGAGRSRIVGMHLLEAATLALLGGALGIALALGLVRLLGSQAPEEFPGAGSISVDGTVLVYALGATALATVLAGLFPALQAGRMNASASLAGTARGEAGRARSRLTPLLVATQIALAVLVTVGSGLMLRSLDRLLAVDPGLDAAGVLTLRPNPPAARYPDGTAFREYYREVRARLAAVPGVEAVGGIHLLPGTTANWSFPAFPEDVEQAPDAPIPSVNFRAVQGDYFGVVRVPLLAGRLLAETDRDDTEPVMLVNRAFVERFWPGEDPLGKEVRLFSETGDAYRVVGVVGDVRQHARASVPRPEMYFSHEQVPWNQMTFWMMVRVATGAPLDYVREVQEAVWSVDPSVPISGIADLGEVLGRSTRTTRFVTLLLTAFGALALLLGAVGVYGVTSYATRRRRPEFGVRLALGSSRWQVVRSAMRGSFFAAAAGLVAGLLGAALTTDLLQAVLYGVEPGDPATFVGVALVLGGVATIAALLPAWKATQVDLATVLSEQ